MIQNNAGNRNMVPCAMSGMEVKGHTRGRRCDIENVFRMGSSKFSKNMKVICEDSYIIASCNEDISSADSVLTFM
jgi:hypothetical protein